MLTLKINKIVSCILLIGNWTGKHSFYIAELNLFICLQDIDNEFFESHRDYWCDARYWFDPFENGLLEMVTKWLAVVGHVTR